jgi:hydrogenase maturation protein HypF
LTIEIEGSSETSHTFIDLLQRDPPQLAEILEVTVSEVASLGSVGFDILESREEAGEFALVSPDAGTCEACWRDFGDPSNRRFGYAFTNCTHCGPRLNA